MDQRGWRPSDRSEGMRKQEHAGYHNRESRQICRPTSRSNLTTPVALPSFYTPPAPPPDARDWTFPSAAEAKRTAKDRANVPHAWVRGHGFASGRPGVTHRAVLSFLAPEVLVLRELARVLWAHFLADGNREECLEGQRKRHSFDSGPVAGSPSGVVLASDREGGLFGDKRRARSAR